jgi:hypothetical protein
MFGKLTRTRKWGVYLTKFLQVLEECYEVSE